MDYDFFTGSPALFAQSSIYKVNRDSAQSANINRNQKAEMGVEIKGPIDVSFYWKVSSQAGRDFLRVTVYDNNFSPTSMTQRISGERDWALAEMRIPAGNYFLIWDYTKNGSVDAGADAGWIDNIEIGCPSRNVEPKMTSVSSLIMLLLD
ncbi:MAG: hypothetical protein ACI9FR_000862 [Cryomorphaceae bacterium]|jgi:hypothetical protein